MRWEGKGADEKGYDTETNALLVVISPYYYRPTEVDTLLGDCSKAKMTLGWSHEVKFLDLVKEMVDYDISEISSSKV